MRDGEQRFPSSLSAGGPCGQIWHRQGCPLFDIVHPAFPLPTTASPTLQGALKDGFGESVVACDMPKLCNLLSLDSCQKRLLWTHKEVDLAPHPSYCSSAPSRRCGDVSSGTWFRKPVSFSSLSKQDPCFTAMQQNGGDKRLVELYLACKTEGAAPPDTV